MTNVPAVYGRGLVSYKAQAVAYRQMAETLQALFDAIDWHTSVVLEEPTDITPGPFTDLRPEVSRLKLRIAELELTLLNHTRGSACSYDPNCPLGRVRGN